MSERKTIHLGEVSLAGGYAGVGEAHQPTKLTAYGFVVQKGVVPGVRCHWQADPRPDDGACEFLGLASDQPPKYSVTVLVPHILMGTLRDRWEGIEEECERLRREYRAAQKAAHGVSE